MLDEQRSRSSASSTALAAFIFSRYKLESIELTDWFAAILIPSTSEGMTRVSAPRPCLGYEEIRSFTRSPARETLLERASSSKTARGDISPPYSLTSPRKERLPPSSGSDFGSPFRVRNRRSVSQPRATRSAGMRVVGSDSKHCVRLSIRFISFLGKPVIAATFDWLTLPFFSRAFPEAARTKASRARMEKLFGVIPRGSSANASSPSRCCKSAYELSVRLGLLFRCVYREPCRAERRSVARSLGTHLTSVLCW